MEVQALGDYRQLRHILRHFLVAGLCKRSHGFQIIRHRHAILRRYLIGVFAETGHFRIGVVRHLLDRNQLRVHFLHRRQRFLEGTCDCADSAAYVVPFRVFNDVLEQGTSFFLCILEGISCFPNWARNVGLNVFTESVCALGCFRKSSLGFLSKAFHPGGIHRDLDFLLLQAVYVLDELVELCPNDLNLKLNLIHISGHVSSSRHLTSNPAAFNPACSALSNHPDSTTISCALLWNGLGLCPSHGNR